MKYKERKNDQFECQKTYLQPQIKDKPNCRELLFGNEFVCSIRMPNINILVMSTQINIGEYE